MQLDSSHKDKYVCIISLLRAVLCAMILFSQGHICVYDRSVKEGTVCNETVLTRA